MNDTKKPLKERLSSRYRLIILNDSTLEEQGQYNLSLQNIYFLLSGALLLLGFLIVSLIVFTPIKKLIPGYGELTDNKLLLELNNSLDEIDRTLTMQETYMLSLRKMLTADELHSESPEKENSIKETLDKIDSDQNKKDVGTITLPTKVKPKSSPSHYFLYPPISGTIGAAFNPNEKHIGIDILAPANTPVKSVADGQVIMSDWSLKTGNTIGIQHANSMITFYKHNSALLKEEGERVKAGEAIAIVGNSGVLTDGPHLHFELWFDGEVVNPTDYIDF